MDQVTDGHVENGGSDSSESEEGEEYEDYGGEDCYIADPVYGYMNAGVLASVNSIRSDLNNLGDTIGNIGEQIDDIGGSFSASGNIKEQLDNLLKYIGTEIDGNFADDPKIKEYTRLRKIISGLSAQFDNLKLVYDAMPSDSEYSNYIVEEYKSAFTTENIDALSAYVVKKGIGDKVKIIAEIKQMIDQYNIQ